MWVTQEIDQDLRGVEPALLSGAHDAGEHLLCLGTACRAVAATDFAVDHGGAEGLFRAPVGRIDGGVAEKAKEGRQFDTQMRGKAVHRGERADVVERRQDPTDQVAACDRDAVVGAGEPVGCPREALVKGGTRTWRVGSCLHARPGVTLDFDSTRRDLATWAVPEYGLLLRTSARW